LAGAAVSAAEAGPGAAADFQEEEHPVAGELILPHWLKHFLDAEGARAVRQSVEQAETKTQAEIVPMIVRSSSSKGFLPFHLFLIFTLISVLFFRDLPYQGVFVLILLSLPLSFALSTLAWIQRIFIPKSDQEQDVFHRAHFEFHQRKLSHTRGKTGVLIFVSLNERRAVVLADEGISQKVRENAWQETIDTLLAGIKRKKAAEGFCAAIEHCTALLCEVAPAQKENPNEISNRLVIEE
jgi:putative membrane protein